MRSLVIRSGSPAQDCGLLALRDVAQAGAGVEGFRVIGGHMIYLLRQLYRAAGPERLTADADAGIDREAAAAGGVQEALVARGYMFRGGSFRRRTDAGELAVDLLIPKVGRRTDVVIGRYGFFASGGLGLALALPQIWVDIAAQLYRGEEVKFVAPLPDVEAAFILKIHAWCDRLAQSDLADLAVLLEIVHQRPTWLASPWRLDTGDGVSGGERRDASRLVHNHLLAVSVVPERVRALAAQYVHDGR